MNKYLLYAREVPCTHKTLVRFERFVLKKKSPIIIYSYYNSKVEKSQTLPTDQSLGLWLLSLVGELHSSLWWCASHAGQSALANTQVKHEHSPSTNCELFQIHTETKSFMYIYVFLMHTRTYVSRLFLSLTSSAAPLPSVLSRKSRFLYQGLTM